MTSATDPVYKLIESRINGLSDVNSKLAVGSIFIEDAIPIMRRYYDFALNLVHNLPSSKAKGELLDVLSRYAEVIVNGEKHLEQEARRTKRLGCVGFVPVVLFVFLILSLTSCTQGQQSEGPPWQREGGMLNPWRNR